VAAARKRRPRHFSSQAQVLGAGGDPALRPVG